MCLLGRPGHTGHVLADGQDSYVQAFTCQPLRALIGNGLLTSEGERWQRHAGSPSPRAVAWVVQ